MGLQQRSVEVAIADLTSDRGGARPGVRGVRPDVVLLDLDLGGAIGNGSCWSGRWSTSGCGDRGQRHHHRRQVRCRARARRLGRAGQDDRLRRPAATRSSPGAQGREVLTRRAAPRAAVRAAPHPVARSTDLTALERLSDTEREVLDSLVSGSRWVASRTERFVAESTVRSQVRAILQKLGVNSQLEAVALAARVQAARGADRTRVVQIDGRSSDRQTGRTSGLPGVGAQRDSWWATVAATAAGEGLGVVLGELGYDVVHDAGREQVGGADPWASAISAAWSMSPCTMTLAPSGGSGESQAFSVAITTCGRQQRERAAAAALAEDHRDGRHGHRGRGSAMQRAISPAIAPSSASRRQLGARGVDDGDQRQAELLGQPHAAPGLAQGGRAERRAPASAAAGPGRRARTAARRAGSGRRARLASCSPSLGAVQRERCRVRRTAAGRARRPARSRRVARPTSQTGRLERGRVGPDGAGPAARRGRPARPGRGRPAPAGPRSATTASMTPLAARFSAVCTPAGNGWPLSAS